LIKMGCVFIISTTKLLPRILDILIAMTKKVKKLYIFISYLLLLTFNEKKNTIFLHFITFTFLVLCT
jgi:hypothetical protein